MPAAIDLSGQKFNRLTVIKKAKNTKYVMWHCVCDCGNEVIKRTSEIKRGIIKSCGCFKSDAMRAKKTSHGLTGTPEYRVWATMKRRCADTSNPYYGGKGIGVCDRWIDSFQNFIEDMGCRPSNKHSIERLNSNKGYSPDNCVWADRFQQANNVSDNILVRHNGEIMTVAELSRLSGLCYATLYKRIVSGWPEDRWLEKPRKDKRYT